MEFGKPRIVIQPRDAYLSNVTCLSIPFPFFFCVQLSSVIRGCLWTNNNFEMSSCSDSFRYRSNSLEFNSGPLPRYEAAIISAAIEINKQPVTSVS